MTSVREALNVIGQAVGIKEVAHQREASFPLSLRNFVGALPAGRFHRKVISLDLVRRKLDQFINDRARPLFLIRLHGEQMGASMLSVFMDDLVDGYDRDNPMVTKELSDPGKPLTFPGILFGEHRFRFSDVNSDFMSVELSAGQPASLEVFLRFETAGEEIKVEDFPNIDFDAFHITLKLEFTGGDGSADLVGWIDEIEAALANAKLTAVGRIRRAGTDLCDLAMGGPRRSE